jgi:superoxide dismutase
MLTIPNILPLSVYYEHHAKRRGVYNHFLYFNGLAPAPFACIGRLSTCMPRIVRALQPLKIFKKQFTEKAAEVFGSGWTCLTYSPEGCSIHKSQKPGNDSAPQTNPFGGCMGARILFKVQETSHRLPQQNLEHPYLSMLNHIN